MKEMINKEQTLIVGLDTKDNAHFDLLMEELALLAEACNLEVVGQLVQRNSHVNNATYIGSGKVEELRMLAEANDATRVIFNHELSPKQLRNLEKALNLNVQDRTALILEIFNERAKTKEARMQVELANLKYLLPRLAGSYMSLGRQGGGSGVHNKGAGEKKIELDRRRAEEKISELEKAIAKLECERQTQRKSRSQNLYPSIALVGYTNSGKSTLMNAYLKASKANTQKEVFEKDMLFATLDTSTRFITLPNKCKVLLSDTVGFVSELPHTLVKAFSSTLEEVVHADLLLHVIDYSNPDFEMQKRVTEETLKEIGAEHVPMIYVYNKCDKVNFEIPSASNDQTVYISAKAGMGLDTLATHIEKNVLKDYVPCEMLIPYESGAILSTLNALAYIKNTEYLENGTKINVLCAPSEYKKYAKYLTESTHY